MSGTKHMKQIDIDRLAGEILRLDGEAEGLVTAGRLFFGQQVRMIGYVYAPTFHRETVPPFLFMKI